MIATYSAHSPDTTTAALGIHLIVYCAVGACLAFGLYALLQPSRAPDSGLATYGAVVKYGKPSLTPRFADPIAPLEQAIAPAALIRHRRACCRQDHSAAAAHTEDRGARRQEAG
jgi:hypothetical protein